MPGKWQSIALPPSVASGAFSAETMLLLTDGSLLVHNAYQAEWLRFIPDPQQGYAGGAWGPVSTMSVPRGFFASGVLRNGQVFVCGGEVSGANSDISSGEVFDPNANAWTQMADTNTPPSYIQGDVPACVLADGRVVMGSITDNETAVWDPANSSWVAAGTAFGTQPITKTGDCNEETWTLLPDGSVLTVNTKVPSAGPWSNTPTSAERYLPLTDVWQATNPLPDVLTLTTVSDNSVNPPIVNAGVFEIGPAILLPSNGKVIAFGATGHTAIYDPATSDWTAGPDFPADPGDPSNNNLVLSPTGLLTLSDAPACLQPNGRVLVVAGTLYLYPTGPADFFSKNSQYFEYDPAAPVATSLTKLAAQPPSGATSQDTWTARFLVLSTGQIMLSTQQAQVYIYTPDPTEGSYQAAWQPSIVSFPSTLIVGHSYLLTGQGLNGLSQANSYGDDAQMATNYPIVQITDTVSHAVYYLQTQDFSTLGVVTTGNQTCSVTVPAGTPTGSYSLVVIANGIPSAPQTVEIGTQDISFMMEETTYGGGQVQAQINLSGTPAVFPLVLYVQAEGFTLAQCGITGAASLASPTRQPTVSSPDPRIVFSYAGNTAVEDLANSGPQRVQYPFQVSFKDTTIFSDPTYFPAGVKAATLAIGASFTPPSGPALMAQGTITLTQTPNPFILHNDPSVETNWYLSQDLRVFQVTAGTTYLGTAAPNTGNAINDATNYISTLIQKFNGDRAAADTLFDTLSEDEGDTSQLTLAPTDQNGTNVFNFALARIRTQDVSAANDVRVFFRMWAAQQTNAIYDPSTTYASRPSGTEKIPVLGVQNDQIITIPFFATPRINAGTASMATQTDAPNVQTAIAPDPLGAEVHTFYGCWLDINQTGQSANLFPSLVLGDAAGPFNTEGPLLPIQSFAASDHQCLIAEISYDLDPVPIGSDPSNTDKLAQRNLSFVNVPNPGRTQSRIVPQTFEIRPSPARLLADNKPDELRFDFSSLPHGCHASVYLPTADSATILDWATRLYTTHRLTATDAHTIRMPASGTGFMPIPQVGAINLAGLLTVDFPATVKKGQKFQIVVSQITGTLGSVNKVVGAQARSLAVAERRPWRRVLGQFRLTVPVLTKHDILPDAERLLSILEWTFGAMSDKSRWHPIFVRYLDQLKGRLTFLGGDPTLINPSPTGVWQFPYPPGHGGGRHDHWHRRERVRGKVDALTYDHFGDFEGFVLETLHGHRRFFASRERRIEDLARRACEERLTTEVIAADDGREILSMLLH
jgi:Kelch motif